MKTIGLIGGMSWESSAIYYRLLNEGAKERLGGLHSAKILLWSLDFAEVAELQAANDWAGLTAMMIEAAQKLEYAGAGAIVICTNTMHKMAPEIEQNINIPLIHIADATAKVIQATACKKPILLATRYTMEQGFYKDRLKQYGIDAIIPDDAGRTLVHNVIYEELCRGIVNPSSKQAYLDEIAKLRGQGADGVILGCTEIGMLLSQQDLDIQVFDTTPIHAKAALDFALI